MIYIMLGLRIVVLGLVHCQYEGQVLILGSLIKKLVHVLS